MVPLDWMDVKGLPHDASGGSDPEPRAAAGGGERAAGPRDHRTDALLEGLNPPQRDAVTHGEGPLLILAGAGSGKTRVITRRVAWLLAEHGARPHELLAITFTNKAAREMRERIAQLVPIQGLWISTFHSMCARILRREIEALGDFTRDFTIYDTSDRNLLLKELIKEAGYDATQFRPAAVGGWISAGKNRCAAEAARPGELVVEDEVLGMEHEVLRTVARAYDAAMRKHDALDFDDLLLKVLELFDGHPGVRDAYADRFRYVMVDEYQDTNRVQYLLTRHLAGRHGNLAVCGDPDQSIYAWRGADVRNILDFERDFGAARVVKLEQNYRSTGNILAAAQAVIRNNRGRKEKDLWTDRCAGDRIALVQCADENDEADEIAAQIRSLLAQGRRADEVAVFYRVNFMQRALERGLRLASIPYQIVGGVEFYARREIKDLVAYLQLVVNPRNDVACQRVLNVPPRGVGAKSQERLAAWAADRRLPLLRAAASDEARAAIRGQAKKGLAAFAGLLELLEPLRDAPALEALDRVLEETEYFDYLAQLPDADQALREENVEELRVHAEAYDRASPEGRLRGFLQDIALVSDVDTWEEDHERVTLMTLHSAKGLELPFVFIAGLEDELLPHARALGEEGAGDDAGLEEERRLMYVGITRAQERLTLTWAERRLHFGELLPRMRSRFVDEIPPELLDGVDPVADEDDVLGVFEASDAACELAVGAWVEHDHFGKGVVERLQGSGVNARATVSFTLHGTKELLLQYAKLRVVEA